MVRPWRCDVSSVVVDEKWPVLVRHPRAAEWLRVWGDLGRAERTIDAYGRGLSAFLAVCERDGIDPLRAGRADVAVFVRELMARPNRWGANVVSIDSGAGLSNATIQQRLVPVRLFYDFLVEEGVRESNPVGRGRFVPGRRGGSPRGLVPRHTKLPWIPSEAQWLDVLEVAAGEPIRNRVMLALAYDAALRREELCSLRTDDLDPGRRMLRVRAEVTKNRLERTVPYSDRWACGCSCPRAPCRRPAHDGGKVVHAQDPRGGALRLGNRAQHANEGGPADPDGCLARQPGAGPAGQRERDHDQQLDQLEAAPSVPDRQPAQLLAEDLPRAVQRLADEPARPQADQYLLPGHRCVGQPPFVPAVHSGRGHAARRARRLFGVGTCMDADHPLLM
jgi:hypothetical protein